MEDYLKRILNYDLAITHGVYEPPNNIPILRYKVNKEGYKVIILGTEMKLSCINWLKTELITPTYVFDTLDELDTIDEKNKYFVVIADPNYKFTAFQSKMLMKFSELGIRDYLCPYDYEKIPKHDLSYLEYFNNNYQNIIYTMNILADTESKRTYIEYIRSKIFCDFYRLTQHPTWNKYFDEDVYFHKDDEVFVNCGASNGDTIFYYLEKFDSFKEIIALENDKQRVSQFKENMMYLIPEIREKIVQISTLVDGTINKLDNLCGNYNVSLINMDIEGMELEALKGARNIIENNKPVIAVCAYHLPSDLYELPMFLKNLCNEYEIFYRKYASTIRNRFCNAELVMYAVPQKRLVKHS